MARKLVQALATLSLAVSLTGQQADAPAYRNPDLAPEKRAADLVGRMTLEEKVLQMQDQAPAIERLGVPAYGWWNEALHGVARNGEATVFPQAIALAATWDTVLEQRIGDIISTEARAKYNDALSHDVHSRYAGLTFWSPNINIFRDPRWGRGQETFGEDPYLTGRIAVAFIHGVQGNDPHYFKAIATAKHYAVHSGPEPERHKFDVRPSERDMNGTYLAAFRMAVSDGKVDSIMCAYNAVDGVPACANTDLLQKDLKSWGFGGYIVSDCGAIGNFYQPNGHKYSPSATEASASAVKAGTDLTCGNEYGRGLPDAVKKGLIKESEIDGALARLFTARMKLGMFDPPERVPFSKITLAQNDNEEHRQAALQAARESIVLLKNDDRVLPLKASVKKIAVIGPSADDPVALLGNYNGFSKSQVSPLEGIEKVFAGKAEIRYSMGSPYVPGSLGLMPVSALTPPNGKGHGVLAEYFDNADYSGQPKLSRVEDRIFQQEKLVDPAVAAAIPSGPASVRWTGTLTAPLTGDYQIAATSLFPSQRPRIFFDGSELATPAIPAASGRGRGRGGPAPFHVSMEAGHTYKLRVEYKMTAQWGTAELQWLPPAQAMLADAVDAVKNSDVAVAFVGLNSHLEGEEMPVSEPGFLGGDRTALGLPQTQENLVKAAIETGKPVIVVLTSGSAIAANYAADHAAALLELWYGGEEAGTAIAQTLAGANNPSGRLPVTFYKSVDQLPNFDDYSMDGRTYRYFKGEPLYGFGYGLSYSTFQYSAPKGQATGSGWDVSVRVKNTAGPEGDEVVQLYVTGAPYQAIRSLRGFQRVHLRAGESKDVKFTLEGEDLPKDRLQLTVGGGQPSGKVPHVDLSLHR
ncbi:MAG TPA: glycoside hydrolase family 3 C-terminal domain-containing protein [Bryobacteraceae bacterium]|jgi:beta-glucosidase|nr:glycoside hydrolase family 3 C-terminal domain-containing protein [Bryobacteraceae bacterium]